MLLNVTTSVTKVLCKFSFHMLNTIYVGVFVTKSSIFCAISLTVICSSSFSFRYCERKLLPGIVSYLGKLADVLPVVVSRFGN